LPKTKNRIARLVIACESEEMGAFDMKDRRNIAINGARLVDRLESLARIGRLDDGSCQRLALTDEDKQGRDLLVSWMRELELEVRVDRIGNIFGIRKGLEDIPAIMTGSHIDTVAAGGKYDGCYGVIAGLEIAERLNEERISTRRPFVVASFTNEEGVRFQPDMLGSLAYAGGIGIKDAWAIRSTDGRLFGEELKRIGYDGTMEPGAVVPQAFIEIHIEQGPILDKAGESLGVVVDLQGISWQEITVRGFSNHAGTTPMGMRKDAGYGAFRIGCYVRDLALEAGGVQVGTVGSIKLSPNLINVIPNEAVVTVDLRNTDNEILMDTEGRLDEFLRDLAQSENLAIETRRLSRFDPVAFDESIVKTIEEAGLSWGKKMRRMTSGAGQDAQMVARLCPAAMIFVPSVGGISHNALEYTRSEDLELGANVLLRASIELANRRD
jgi:N-carbamoyl-L-amino-acid hydrolase